MAGPTIDENGFHVFGLANWLDLLETDYRSIYGSDIDLSPDSADGQWMGILAGRFADLEELLQVIYLGRSPSGAVGAGLSRLVQLNGVNRKTAQFSTAPITLSGVPGTVVPINSLIGDPDDPTLPPFKTVAGYTIGGGGTVAGQAICTVSGPVNVSSGKLTRIMTITNGWNAVTNTSAAAPGRLVEPDPILRSRRAASVAMPSQSMLDGLYAAIADLPGVDDVVVYENTGGTYNEKGEPPHSIHVIVDGGLDADIANAIWVKSSMGCTKFGQQSAVVTDTQGNPQAMRWDIPSDLNVYITVALSRAPSSFEATAIKNALVAFGQETSKIGQNVPWGDLFSPINVLNLTGGPGLPSIKTLKLGSAPGPTDQDDLVVAFDARPRYDAANILVVSA